jgi:hypothetical protein
MLRVRVKEEGKGDKQAKQTKQNESDRISTLGLGFSFPTPTVGIIEELA